MTTTSAFYCDPSQPVGKRVEDLLARMTLSEKIGQMTQVEKDSLQPADVTSRFIGSVLSGGGAHPRAGNTPDVWLAMVNGFQTAALETRLGIPLLYGVDAVHGHNNVYGATIFPHNIGLGAARDPDLVERIGRATAEEVAATGIFWNFAPTIAVPQDIRWGRTYEGYAENTAVTAELGRAYIRGMQTTSPQVAACAKHFLGDGGTMWGTSTMFNVRPYSLDQGDTQMDEARLRALFLPPYKAALEAGVYTIMVSFSSWNGTKMHAHKYLLTDLLKGELGFRGFLISDWQAVDQIPGGSHQAVVASINAGLDMNMVPYDYERFIAEATSAVEGGEIPLERVDDAVRRILGVKFRLGLFERPFGDPASLAHVGSAAHRALAREAVRKSLVLLKNEHRALPLDREMPRLLVGGPAADDIGLQSGGWTIEWIGAKGRITPGTTLLEGIRQSVAPGTSVEFDPLGEFDGTADAGIAVIAEEPYVEGTGDQEDLSLSPSDVALLERMRAHCRTLVVILLSGRPLILTEQLPQMDALVAAFLPGTEGAGVADGLFGDFPFSGKLPYTWPRSNDQLPFDFETVPAAGEGAPLFPYGYGLAA